MARASGSGTFAMERLRQQKGKKEDVALRWLAEQLTLLLLVPAADPVGTVGAFSAI